MSLLYLCSCRDNQRAESHALARTRMEMEDIATRIRVAASENQVSLLIKSASASGKVSPDILYEWLTDTNINDSAMNPVPQEWAIAKKVVDRWGRDVHVSFLPISGNNRFNVRLWSDGPNERNDLGKNDDIVIKPFEIALKGSG